MKKLIGLTGKTGAGKSTVSKHLLQKGAYIIDGDVVARKVLVGNDDLLNQLREAFGDVLNDDGTLNRKALAEVAFASPENTDKLNKILHPVINEYIRNEVNAAFSNYDVVCVDAAAIIESGFADECDMLCVVYAPDDIRRERIMKRDNITERDANVRMNGQKDDDFYLSRAHRVINAYGPYSLAEQLSELEKELFS